MLGARPTHCAWRRNGDVAIGFNSVGRHVWFAPALYQGRLMGVSNRLGCRDKLGPESGAEWVNRSLERLSLFVII
jgi:hypothetical protein